jgi:hypothetical protein
MLLCNNGIFYAFIYKKRTCFEIIESDEHYFKDSVIKGVVEINENLLAVSID